MSMPTPQEVDAAMRWIDWSNNKCGKGPLEFEHLPRLAEMLPRNGVYSVGTLMPRNPGPTPHERSIILIQLEQAWRGHPFFPRTLTAWYEGPYDGGWVIEVYGEGEPYPMLPEPPKPEYMR